MQERKQFWDSNTTVPKETAEALFARERSSAEDDLYWRQQFSGKIPRHWDDWNKIIEDFKRAHQTMPNVTLNRTLVDAGITHPLLYVATEVGKTQHLNDRQLLLFFVRSGIRDDVRKEVSDAQREFGVSRRDIWATSLRARMIRRRMEKAGIKTNTLTLESPHLPPPSNAEQQ